MKYQCLIVDDEIELAESTAEYFNLFDVKTKYVTNYDDCIEFFKTNTADVILLDINLADASGFAVCKQLRETIAVPILFISARTSNEDILVALNIGGDDYITKPYTLSILLAKVQAVIKRYASTTEKKEESEQYEKGNLRVDFTAGKVYSKGKEIPFKAMEYRLLCYLIKNRGRIISKEELFKEVWQDAITGDGTLNVHIRYLREKIEENPNEPIHIKTVWGRGYQYEE
ncbi:response regulator transcription factor [Anaerosporobacter faecicola]|uniref:response regulator transcription factor n=1 Tax=Anaerosporobacter faecicola TaxID=2718714 RepID=UPI001438ABAE|nr:response regulator transcription factor [Anaerosporobacter faecicola]